MSQKKKICLIGNSSWSLLNFRSDLIKSLLNKYEVFIVAPDREFSKEIENMECQFIFYELNRKSINPFKELKAIWKLSRIFKSYNFDYVLSFNIKPNLYSCIAGSFIGTRVMPNVSGLGSTFLLKGLLPYIIKYLYKLSFKFADHIFFQNKADLEIFIQSKIIFAQSYSVLPGSGINLLNYPKNNQHLLTIKDQYNFTYLGRMIKDKGVQELLQAAKYFDKNSNISFNLYGDFDDNNPSALSLNEIKPYLSPNIRYHGRTDSVLEVLGKTACVILPSYREGMSRTLLEAAGCGIPLIASDVPGCKEIVIDGYNGFIVAPRDVNSLKIAIQNFIKLKNEKVYQLGSNSRKLVERDFSVEKIISEYNRILMKD